MRFLNRKRLQVYPRLMLLATWSIMLINLIFHQGWMGAFGQIIAGDFIMFYSTGMIYRSNPNLVYDYHTQQVTQQSLVSPTLLPGHNPYMNPPYVAPLYSIISYVSLSWSFILWTVLSLLSVLLSIYFLRRIAADELDKNGLTYIQLTILTFSFFPFIEGLQAGQNHWLSLLLISGIVYTTMKEKPYISGILAGLLLYKPQYVIGFILVWLIWKNYKALFSFAFGALLWIGAFVLSDGIELIQKYLELNSTFMNLPYIPGFPKYLLVTFYGLLTSFFPQNTQPALAMASQVIFIILAAALIWLAIKLRYMPFFQRTPAVVGAILFPLLTSPYALLHDAVILVPAFVLWMVYTKSQKFLTFSMIIYLGVFIFTFVGVLTKIAWVSFINFSLAMTLMWWIYQHRRTIFEANQ